MHEPRGPSRDVEGPEHGQPETVFGEKKYESFAAAHLRALLREDIQQGHLFIYLLRMNPSLWRILPAGGINPP